MIPLRRKVLWWAVYSRGFVITLQVRMYGVGLKNSFY